MTNQNRVPSKAESVAAKRVRDEEHINNFVHRLLSTHQLAVASGVDVNENFIKISMRDVERVLIPVLKNTRGSRLRDLICDTLTGYDVANLYGSWVFADFDSPDFLLIKLPDFSTNVIAVEAKRLRGTTDYVLNTIIEQLQDLGSEPEDEDIEDEDNNPINWPMSELQHFVMTKNINMEAKDFGNKNKLLLAVRKYLKANPQQENSLEQTAENIAKVWAKEDPNGTASIHELVEMAKNANK